MNKQGLLDGLTETVRRKHPHRIPEDRYVALFKELPQAYLREKAAYDTLLEKAEMFTLCHLVLSQVKIEIRLTLEELIQYELSLDKWAEARAHNILPGDIKKRLKEPV